MNKILEYGLPTLLCGGLVAGKNIFIDGFIPEDVHVWIDVLLNMSEFMASKLAVEMLLDVQSDAALLAEPAIHSLLNGVTKEFLIDRNKLSSLRYYKNSGRVGKLPPPSHYTFMNGAQDGVLYNVVTNYLYLPFKNMI